MRLIFMGTPDFAVPTLAALVGHGHEVTACYTQPPRPAGRRGLDLKKSPVHEKADEFGLSVRTPQTLKTAEEQADFAALDADVAVVVAYGMLLPDAVLAAPRLGCYNGHASLLPRWRGAAPIQRAIMAGDDKTGMMVMKMDEGLDTGPVAMSETVAIGPDMTAGELHDELARIGADLMIRAMAALERDSLTLTPQDDDGATYAKKIDKAETRIDWSRPAADVHNHIRGLSPFPGAWCEVQSSGRWERTKLLASTLDPESGGIAFPCADGPVYVTRLQRAGARAMDAAEFRRGFEIGAVR